MADPNPRHQRRGFTCFCRFLCAGNAQHGRFLTILEVGRAGRVATESGRLNQNACGAIAFVGNQFYRHPGENCSPSSSCSRDRNDKLAQFLLVRFPPESANPTMPVKGKAFRDPNAIRILLCRAL